MTTMRVTVGSFAYTGLKAIRATSENLAVLQDQMSSGKLILKPSDNPSGTVRAMGLRGAMARNDQYMTNSDDAIAWLSAADSAYSQISSVLQQARTTVVAGLNSGANDANANQALAAQLDGLRQSLLGLANTSYDGRPVFGGTTASGTAYDSAGNYVGDAGSVTRAVGPNQTVTVSASGPDVFGSTGSDVFTMLSDFSTALRSNPSTLSSTALTQLDSAISRLSTAQATEGATYARVQTAQAAQTTAGTAMTTQLSGIEDIDPAETAIKLATANTAYQAALQTTASIGQVSLLDFLR
jgi:flagellar hook-associated protein 3 FlgL